VEKSVEEVGVVKRGAILAPLHISACETEVLSQDDYIKQLEAEIQRLQAFEGKASTSNTCSSCN